MTNSISVVLGERIKRKRKEAGMTQSEVCGDVISRNMLSLIENGEANPSIDTLIYIAERLKVSPAYFLCQSENEAAQYELTQVISEIRNAYSASLYKRCADLCLSAPFNDETAGIFASCRIRQAISEFDSYRFSQFHSYLTDAEKVCSEYPSVGAVHFADISLLQSLANELANGKVPSPSSVSAVDSMNIPFSRQMYILFISCCETSGNITVPEELFPKKSIYRAHFEAKKLLWLGEYEKAFEILSAADFESVEPFAAYFMMKDAENAAVKLERFREAYSFSENRSALAGEIGKYI